MTEAICLEESGCMVRQEMNTAKKDVDILFQQQRRTDEKVQAIEVSMAAVTGKITGTLEFLKWAIPVSVTITGIVVAVLVKVIGG